MQKNAFIDYKYLFLFTVLFAAFCWIGGYLLADFLFTPEELVDYEFLAQETFFSITNMLYIIINNCFVLLIGYIGAIFFGMGPIWSMISNFSDWGITSRATELAVGDPFLFMKLTCLHGFFEDLALILNSFAGFILFSFIARFIKNLFSPSEVLCENTFFNSWKINKKHLYESLVIFVIALFVMIFAGFLEEFLSVPFGNLLAEIL